MKKNMCRPPSSASPKWIWTPMAGSSGRAFIASTSAGIRNSSISS